jgi:hypothetical protein
MLPKTKSYLNRLKNAATSLAIFVASAHLNSSTISATDAVVIPPIYGTENRTAFHRELIEKALNLETLPWEATKLHNREEAQRAGSTRRVSLFLQGKYDLMWAPPRQDLEEGALRVNFPFLKGLRGYRVLLAHSDLLPTLEKVSTIDEIRHLVAGLGIGWTDVNVFNANRLTTLTAPNHDDLWRMMNAKRFDYYPRGIAEILPELNARTASYPAIKIEPSLVIYYPFPLFYYVRKGREDLHAKLSENLEALKKSGEFDALWLQAHKTLLKDLNFAGRKVIALKAQHLKALETDWPRDMLITPNELMKLSNSLQ